MFFVAEESVSWAEEVELEVSSESFWLVDLLSPAWSQIEAAYCGAATYLAGPFRR
jgi:hypothetical protein